MNRYSDDVLAPGWQKAGRPTARAVPLEPGLVVEVDGTDFCGAVVGWENGFVILEDRHARRRSFPIGTGFHLEGQPVRLCVPARRTGASPATGQRTASGSRARGEASHEEALVALPSRIYVEGRHDADFGPAPGRRLGVLVDHLVAATKERRIADEVARSGYGEVVLIAGHRFIDVWQAIRPQVLGLAAWPVVGREVDFKKGTLAALGWPHRDQADIARAWQAMLARVNTYRDLDPDFVRTLERLIDFVTQDHLAV